MDNIFRTRALSAAINEMRPVRTPVLDRIFGRKKRQLSDRFAWDIKSSNERLLGNIRVEAPAEVQDNTGRKTVTCEAPRYAPKRFISAADLNAMRAHGSQAGPELLKERIADEQFDMRGDVDRTREFQAVKAIQGTVVDKAGATIVDYGFASANKPTLAGTALWTDAASDPVANIRAWKKLIADEHAVDGFAAFCGSGVMDAALNNTKLLELLKYTMGNQVADQGRIANLAGVAVEEYFGTYKTDAGVRTQLMPDDAFILVGLGPDVAAELYAPVVELDAPGGTGGGGPAAVFHAKSWVNEDPSGRWIKAEARPLPVLFRPGCVVYATVI